MKTYLIRYIKDSTIDCENITAKSYTIFDDTTGFYDDKGELILEIFNSKIVSIKLLD